MYMNADACEGQVLQIPRSGIIGGCAQYECSARLVTFNHWSIFVLFLNKYNPSWQELTHCVAHTGLSVSVIFLLWFSKS